MKQPNIVFIFSDQQRYTAVGCNGNQVVQTPHMDALAASGVALENAISSCPICAPYRGQLLTGKYSHVNGVIDNEYAFFPGQDTLPAALRRAGYTTGYIGKWHLGYGPYTEDKKYGFDYLAANNCDHRHAAVTYYENEKGPIHVEEWSPTMETDLALRFIERHCRRAASRSEAAPPFCLVMSWGPPHWSGPVYDRYPDQYKAYDPEVVDLPPNVPRQMEAFAREELAHYYGNVTGLDHELGRIRAVLDERGLTEDTIFCYTSDHGDHLSSHGYGKPSDQWLHPSKRASKATPYDESVHVPFIVSYPGRIQGGQRAPVMFSSVDIMPTLLALAGVEAPAGIQGTDLSRALLGEGGNEPDSVYLQILGPGWPYRGEWVGFWRGVRTDRWTYARWHHSGECWLFDRECDPYEMVNVAGREECAAIEGQMEDRLQQWIGDTDDPFETGARDSQTGILQLGQSLTSDRHEPM